MSKPGQAVQIDLIEDLNPQTPVGELFAQGPIEIVVTGVRSEQVKLGLAGRPALSHPATALGNRSLRCPTFRPPWRSPALLYLPTSLWVTCAKNSAPTPQPPIPSPAPQVARVYPHDPRPPHPPPRPPPARASLFRDWSQETLVAQAGLHRTYISGIERAPRLRISLLLRCSTFPHPCGSPALRGISTSYTSERNIGLDNVEKLADAFRLAVSDLLDAGD